MEISESSYLKEWKSKMADIIRMKYPKDKLSDDQIEIYLNKTIERNLKDPRLLIVNNYKSKISRTTILKLIELIRKNKLICAGGGCLFLPHAQRRNLLIEFIFHIMDERAASKKKRKKFPKGSDEWAEADREQLAWKLIINSLYGCLGYPGFNMFNIFLAESITNEGRHIITSAINAVENFLGDNMVFENANEVYNVIHTIHDEFIYDCHGSFSEKAIEMFSKNLDLMNLPDMCTKRFLSKCIFAYSPEFIKNLDDMFHGMSTDELLLMYFKNNLMEFSRLDFIKDKIRLLILENGVLNFCENESYGSGNTPEEKDATRPGILAIVDDIWDMYRTFVLYDHPIFDRLQKAMYLDKTKSLYTDTDSVFISLDEFMQFIMHEVFSSPEDANLNEEDLNLTAANVTLTFVNRMIAAAMATLCKSTNITPEYAKRLKLKNEFLFKRIMFSNVKKRYVSLATFQEGQKLYDLETGAIGLPEIKGFDFKKNGAKPFVRDFYTKLCMEEIMYPDNIDPTRIFTKFMQFKDYMEREIVKGNMDFFSQANVKKPEHYKNPYSTQGVCAILLWNALMPGKQLEFPTDINIVPIKELTWAKESKDLSPAMYGAVRAVRSPYESNKNLMWYKTNFSEAYENLHRNIFCSTNPLIQHMNLSSIAIPKNPDYEIPKFITELFDFEGVVNKALSLGVPLLRSVGIQSFQVTTNLEHATNIVSL